ncbi:DUF2913 family protein [Vibrio sinensis]|uniref:DUF2913 family protein n=1 Tax=Vibrio sinensis TaxID=2302434 RepID=A0A3A6Q8B0_9VIBR|nr:DUF2913 family protein [Vibrio sinensis]RJX65818.1 DUF2913 family protein [Vibrio sinensis]
MQIKRDFEYYKNLHATVSHALLHLLSQVAMSQRYCPTSSRNEILIKFLKIKLKDARLANIKKDIKLMLVVARRKDGCLEKKLYELNEQAKKTKLAGAEKFYSLLVYLYDQERLESRLFEEGSVTEPGMLYILEDHIDHCFDESGHQQAPLSMLIQLERAPELIDVINRHGWFMAEMNEWNAMTHQAHIVIHPVT